MSEIEKIIAAHKKALAAGETALLLEMGRFYSLSKGKLITEANTLYLQSLQNAPTPAQAWANLRATSLLDDVREEMNYIGGRIRGSLAADAPRTIRMAEDHVAELAFAGQPGLVAAGYAFNRIDQKTAEQLVGALTGPGSPLAKILSRYGDDAAKGIGEALFDEIIRGRGPDDVARRINQWFAGDEARAHTIARTETFRAYRGAGHATAMENEDVLAGWFWNAALDRNTCASCAAMSGTFWPTEKAMESHPNCRCVQQWVTRTAGELGLDGVGESRVASSPRGADWFADQSLEVQANILGKKGLGYYSTGLVTLEDFVAFDSDPAWGGMYYKNSLKNVLANQANNLGNSHPGYKPVARKRTLQRKKLPRPPLSPLPTPAPAPPAPAAPPEFPESLAGLKEIRGLGGSTGAKLVEDELGRRFVMKRGASADHLREEAATDAVYRAAGVRVPPSRIYEEQSGPVKLARFIEGTTLDAIRDPAERRRVLAELAKDFAVDAFLTNRDVTGMTGDNILVDRDGNVWRIDNGGGLRTRAQGGAKPGLDEWPEDVWSMRDPANLAGQYHGGGLGFYDVGRSAARLVANREAVLAAIPEAIRPMMAKRLEHFADLEELAFTFQDDLWQESYADAFAREVLAIRKEKVLDFLPKELKQEVGGVVAKDEKGKQWDSLRTADTFKALSAWFTKRGGRYQQIIDWASAQGGSSWSSHSMTVKGYFQSLRAVPETAYYNGDHTGRTTQYRWNAAQNSPRVNVNELTKSFLIQHALTYETLRSVRFRFNDQEARAVRTIRVEIELNMKTATDMEGRPVPLDKLKPGERYNITRGAAESSSIWDRTKVAGNYTLFEDVPYHRVLGTYFYASNEQGHRFFLGDGENEFLFLTQGLDVEYRGNATVAIDQKGDGWKSRRPAEKAERRRKWRNG